MTATAPIAGDLPAELAAWVRMAVGASGWADERAEDLAAELLDHLSCEMEGGAECREVLRRLGDPARIGRRLARQALGRDLRSAMQLPTWLRLFLALDLAVLGPWFIAWLPPGYSLSLRFGLVVPMLVLATLLGWVLLGVASFGVGLLGRAPRRAYSVLLGAGSLLSATAAWFLLCMSSLANATAELLWRWPVRHQVELLGLAGGILLVAVALGLLLLPTRRDRVLRERRA